jgi:hypothetical protein
MDPSLRPSRSDEVIWRTLDTGALVVRPADGHTWTLNPVGLFIWDHCDGYRDVAQIEDELARTFGIDPWTAHGDLEDFLVRMEALGLLALAWPASSA